LQGYGSPAATVSVVLDWLEIAGDKLFESGFDAGDAQTLEPGTLYKGPPRYGAERWDFWGERLRLISRDEETFVEARLRERAADAASRIETWIR